MAKVSPLVFIRENRTTYLPHEATISTFIGTGVWKRNNEVGKKICNIHISVPDKGLSLYFAPREELEEELLECWLQCEHDNDKFIFKSKRFGETRSQCLLSKINMVLSVLNRWRNKV